MFKCSSSNSSRKAFREYETGKQGSLLLRRVKYIDVSATKQLWKYLWYDKSLFNEKQIFLMISFARDISSVLLARIECFIITKIV